VAADLHALAIVMLLRGHVNFFRNLNSLLLLAHSFLYDLPPTPVALAM
jgi:hypothetical protein